MTPADRDAGPGRIVLSALAVTVACTLPLLLTGGLAVQLQQDLRFGVVALGGAIAVYRATGAVLAIPLGRYVDRLGPATSMRVATGLAAVACLGIAATAENWGILAVWLALAGVSNVMGQSGANISLTRAVRPRRQGIAFGLKQSALPAAGALAGLSVPLLALTVGWRWAFVATALLALGAGVAVPPAGEAMRRHAAEAVNRAASRRPFVLLAIGLFFGMGAASTLTAFTVDSAVASGIDVGTAGILLTGGSLAAIAVRLVTGVLADRRGGRHLPVVAGLLLTGSLGYVLMGVPRTVWFVLGVVLAFGAGWGFNGLFWFSVVRLNQATPGRATGLVMPGGSIGGMVGPLVFGGIASQWSYSHAWMTAASWAVLAGVFVILGRRQVLKEAHGGATGSSAPPDVPGVIRPR